MAGSSGLWRGGWGSSGVRCRLMPTRSNGGAGSQMGGPVCRRYSGDAPGRLLGGTVPSTWARRRDLPSAPSGASAQVPVAAPSIAASLPSRTCRTGSPGSVRLPRWAPDGLSLGRGLSFGHPGEFTPAVRPSQGLKPQHLVVSCHPQPPHIAFGRRCVDNRRAVGACPGDGLWTPCGQAGAGSAP